MRGSEKASNIQPVGFWSVKMHGWNTCVNSDRQPRPVLGMTGSLEKPGRRFGEY